MTKADIINEIATSTGIAKKDVSAVVESFMEPSKTVCWRRKKMYTFVVSVAHRSTVRKDSS